MLEKQKRRKRRHKRVRAKIKGSALRPRLCVFRSNKHIYAQLIDDQKGKVLVSCSDLELKIKRRQKKTEISFLVGQNLAKKATKLGIKNVVFDRAGYKYHGRVKALAEGARKEGLIF